MNRQELLQILERDGFRADAYDLTGVGRSECYVLAQTADAWAVYYDERGLRTGEQTFRDEHAACNHLLATLRADATTRA